MRFLCVGAGSIGMLFAGRLAAAGAEVELVTNGQEQANTINAEGVSVREGNGKAAAKVAAFSYSEAAIRPASEPDWILLTVKQRHIEAEFIGWLSKRIGARTGLLCFQNGTGHAERLAAQIDPARIFLAVTTEGARKEGKNEVAHTGRGITRIGPAFAGQASIIDMKRQKKLQTSLGSAGFEAVMSKNMDNAVWEKLLINAVINPLTALLGITNGQLLATPEGLCLMDRLLEEGCSLASAKGIDLPFDRMREQVIAVCERTSGNHSSMLQDIQGKRATEIEWINGSLIRESERCGLRLPVNETVYSLIKALERAAGG